MVLAASLYLLGALASNSFGQEPQPPINTTVGFTVSSYQIPSDRYQAVYGSGARIIYGLNLSRTILTTGGFQLDLSLEGRTFSKSGVSTLDQTPAKLTMTPIALAGRFLYETRYVIPFVGFGADWYPYKETSDLATTSGTATGWHYQVGAYVVIPGLDFLRVKLYYKYTRADATQNGIAVQLGGNEYGIGLSFGFSVLNKAVISF